MSILPSYWASKYVVTVGDRSNIYFSFSSHVPHFDIAFFFVYLYHLPSRKKEVISSINLKEIPKI